MRRHSILAAFGCLNADLTKKGLRRDLGPKPNKLAKFERGPDEEGIETSSWVMRGYPPSLNADLTKKGLRPKLTGSSTSASLNADLTKKGLRLGQEDLGHRPVVSFERGPDEEGIETPHFEQG